MAIRTALLAILIAFPVSATGQSSVPTEPGPATFGRMTVQQAAQHSERRQTLRACLLYDRCPATGEGVERSILFAVYGWDSPPARVLFGAADASAYPMFAAAPLVLWGGALAGGLPTDDAVAGSIALAAGFGTTIVLKRLVGRTRPYAAIPGFAPRSGHAGALGLSDTASFPSGHATLAAIVATGAALLIRHPAATTAASFWAGSVSVSRIWLGVHYPTDVIAGLAVGTGSTLLVMSTLR